MSMTGPDRTPEYVQVRQDLRPLLPTPYLEFRGGILHQWHEATLFDEQVGVTFTRGDWRPVPSRS